MESWRQILIAYPYLQTIWDSLLICLPLAALAAYSGIFFISATGKITAISRKRSAFNKCAKQTAFIGLILGWLLLAGGRIWLYYNPPLHASELNGFLQEVSWLLLSIGVLLSSVYYSLWGALKNMPVLHTTIGMISAVQNVVALLAILCSIRVATMTTAPETTAFALPDLFPNAWNNPIYSAICYTAPLIFAMAGAVSACWLVLRRNKDDFGRDYYNAMLPWCCAWARNSWFLLWLLLCASCAIQMHNDWQNHLLVTESMIYDGARVLLWLIPVLFWTLVIRSKPPMRLSILTFVNLVFACAFMLPYYLELTRV